MNIEKSCGAVVYTKCDEQIKYLLVQSLEGFYGFPKGHMEENETEQETALREIKEETSLNVELLPGFRTADSHPIPQKPNTMKEIVYFLAHFEHQTPKYQSEELLSLVLCSYEEALKLFQFESSKRILTEASNFLLGK